MRVYKEEKIIEIYCNKCGKKIVLDNGILKEGVFRVEYKWGYFSKKDGIQHSFDLCEKCYDEMINKFAYPVNAADYTELL